MNTKDNQFTIDEWQYYRNEQYIGSTFYVRDKQGYTRALFDTKEEAETWIKENSQEETREYIKDKENKQNI